MSLLKIILYSTATGKEPISDWLDSLDGTTKAIVLTRLNRIRLGNFGDAKIITNGNGIWELRIHYGSGYRIYFGKERNIIVVLLTGGDKKSQQRDIEKAKTYWLNYKEQK